MIIAIFDGDCGICSKFVEFASRRVAGKNIEFRSYAVFSEPELARFGLTYERCSQAFQLVDESRGVHLREGGPAIRFVLAAGGGLIGSIARATDFLPPLLWLEPIVYSLIARNRTRISVSAGLTGCKVRN